MAATEHFGSDAYHCWLIEKHIKRMESITSKLQNIWWNAVDFLCLTIFLISMRCSWNTLTAFIRNLYKTYESCNKLIFFTVHMHMWWYDSRYSNSIWFDWSKILSKINILNENTLMFTLATTFYFYETQGRNRTENAYLMEYKSTAMQYSAYAWIDEAHMLNTIVCAYTYS